MNDFEKSIIRETSIPLPAGGDAHIHPWSNGRGFTVTTRITGIGEAFHESFRISHIDHTPTDPSVLRLLK